MAMIRFYLCSVHGSGTEVDPFRPALDDAAKAGGLSITWGADDGRVDEQSPDGWMIVWATVSSEEHATLASGVGVHWIPFEDASGNPLGPEDLIGSVSATRRQQIRNVLESHHVPMDDLTLADPIRKVIGRIIRRIRLRKGLALRYADWSLADSQDLDEALDTLVSSLPTSKRNTLTNRLERLGLDVSVVRSGDTVRQALQKLTAQNAAWNQNIWG